MAFDPKNGYCLCQRCGHTWKSKFKIDYQKLSTKYIEPRNCAKCKSKKWNSPRVYGGKYLKGLATMAKRFKPTGRKAAKQKRQPSLFPE